MSTIDFVEPLDLPPEEYIQYMERIFEEAKGFLQYGYVSVSADGGVSVMGWGVPKAMVEEIKKGKRND